MTNSLAAMSLGGLDVNAINEEVSADVVVGGMDHLGFGEELLSSANVSSEIRTGFDKERNYIMEGAGGGAGMQITCFSESFDDVVLHFQIIRLHKQIYAWIGCNSAKIGHLYAAAPTRPGNTVRVTSILGGASDNTGSGIARRLVLKSGLNVILACNIPKNSPMLEANAEKKLVQKLITLGYTKPKANGLSSQ